MYIKSMVIDGFKSYGQRTEINGFDREFNAITGLNGSGKSNILDAICFVLGITNLTQVRAGSLQELVYKSGQAGITKASVTITFDNRDTSKSPLGYERYEEITITRQAVVAGKNRYMINGSTVQNKRVNDLFNSVQLNVNNPHFLIMQGRITKVLNMKPPEILSMIEEAAGTRMYETKKQAAQKTIEKKDAKLKELSDLINEEIGPKLTKLKEERNQYLELQKISREVEHLTKIFIAWQYTSEEAKSRKAQDTLESLNNNVKELHKKITEGKNEEKDVEAHIETLRQKRDTESGGVLAELEKKLTEAEKHEAKVSAKVKSNKDSINSEEKNIKRLEKVVKDDESALADKQKELNKVEKMFVQLKTADEEDSKALAEAQRKFQAVSAGLLTTDDGQEATLQEQLMSVKQEVSCAQSEAKQCTMQLEHNRTQLKNKQNEMKKTETEYVEDNKHLECMEKELAGLQRELSRVNYDEHKMENLQERKRSLTTDIRRLRETVEKFEAQHPALNFYYKDPEPNFNRASVRGLVCSLFRVKDRKFAMALEMAAGGRLYNVVTDNELTSTKLIKNGQLRKRHTFIPLNKIQGYTMDNRTIQYAQDLVGEDRVHPALSLIEFEKQYQPVMNWIFGQVFVCVDMQTAVEVTYNQNILKKCITLDGDVTDPYGSLSGGAPLKSSSILNGIAEYNSSKLQLGNLEREYAMVDAEIHALSKTADIYHNKKQTLEIRQHEVETVRMRLQQSMHHQYQTEIEQLKVSLDTLSKELENCKKREAGGRKKVKELEEKVADAKNLRERELKAAEAEMNRLQKKSEESRKQWKEREGDFESLNLEIKDLKSSIETVQQDIQKCKCNVEQLKEEGQELATEIASAKTTVKELQGKVKEQKEVITKKNKEIQEAMHRKDVLLKEIANSELQCTSLQHNVSKCQAEAKESRSRLIEMEKSYDWILEDRPYFGQPNGIYDFKETDPKEAGMRITKLQELKAKLSRTVNTRAMNILEKEEEQYNEMMKKKQIVIRDKEKIIAVIEELDKKKKEALRLAWEQVNKDFGSIFGSLLPGAQAKLKPPDGKDILDGLEVKVGFNGLWKDSLQELSGGQRSLVALSLILAMLLFKPAPIYILDEVDAALDLSHTQNIGQMLKAHFKHSQFIVVSLKDGMFNNANVLFRTKFVDGMSTVTRTTPGHK